MEVIKLPAPAFVETDEGPAPASENGSWKVVELSDPWPVPHFDRSVMVSVHSIILGAGLSWLELARLGLLRSSSGMSP